MKCFIICNAVDPGWSNINLTDNWMKMHDFFFFFLHVYFEKPGEAS